MAIVKSCCSEGGEDAGGTPDFGALMGPGHVDQQIRNAIHLVWMMLPKERKNPDEVEKEFRRIADRALRDLREDAQAFGFDRNSSG